MAETCPICLRPKRGEPLQDDERPCYQQGGQRCYELGYERLAAKLERLESDPVIRGRVDVMELAGARG